jgi:hypothetical protein
LTATALALAAAITYRGGAHITLLGAVAAYAAALVSPLCRQLTSVLARSRRST